MSKTVNSKILVRRDTSTNWSTNNPVLAAGEIGFDTTNGKHKIGDGSTAWNSLPYFLLESDDARRTLAIPYGQVDSTSTATVFTATIPGITQLYDGVCVYLKNGVITSASGWTLNINNLGALPVYQSQAAASRTTTVFNVAYTGLFIYNSTRVEGGCWDYFYGYNSDTNTTAYQVRRYQSDLVMAAALTRYKICFSRRDGKLIPATATSNSTATTKVLTTKSFDPNGFIFYYSTTTAVAVDASPGASYMWLEYPTVDLRYSFNAGSTLTAKEPVYIKCSPQSDGLLKLAGNDCIVQSLPNSADNYVYLYLGRAYSTYQITLDYQHPIYYYANGAVRIWQDIDIPDELDTVVFTWDDTNQQITCNHTYAQLLALYTNNTPFIVYTSPAIFDGGGYGLVYQYCEYYEGDPQDNSDKSELTFNFGSTGNFENEYNDYISYIATNYITIDEDGTITSGETESRYVQDNVLVVELSQNNNTFMINHTYDQLYAAYNSNKNIILVQQHDNYRYGHIYHLGYWLDDGVFEFYSGSGYYIVQIESQQGGGVSITRSLNSYVPVSNTLGSGTRIATVGNTDIYVPEETDANVIAMLANFGLNTTTQLQPATIGTTTAGASVLKL